jgi:Lon protease-like protein
VRLPLFPLHVVAFPHLPLPLHVFEERYRAMMRDVMADASPYAGRFAVSMITGGAEVEREGVPVTHSAVGTVVEVHSADRFPDGRWGLLAVGEARARLGDVDRSGAYAVVEIEPLPEVEGDPAKARALVPPVQAALDAYLATVKRFVASAASIASEPPETMDVAASLDEVLKPIRLPDEPLAASYAVAGVLQVELMRKQQLLELPDAVSRLEAELQLLRREAQLLSQDAMSPVATGDLRYHPN